MDVTIYGRPNSSSFVHNGKKVKLASLRPAPPPETKQTEASSSKVLTLISPKIIDKEIAKGSTIVVLIAREVTDDSQEQIPPIAVLILKKFVNALLEKLLDSLPPMCDIQHAIDFVLVSTLPNLSHYRMNHACYVEHKRQVDELLSKGLIKKSLESMRCVGIINP